MQLSKQPLLDRGKRKEYNNSMIAIALQEPMRNHAPDTPEPRSTPDRNLESPLNRMSDKARRRIIALICGVGIILHGISFTRSSNEMRAMTVRESLEHFEKNNALEHGRFYYSVLCALRNGNRVLIEANIDSMNFAEFQDRILKDESFFLFVLSATKNGGAEVAVRQ